MATLLSFAPVAPIKVQLHQTYSLPAFLLSDEPVDEQDPSSLQADASSNSKCYLRILRNLDEGTYLAKVAAYPEQVIQGFTLIVTNEQMAHSQPYQV